MYTLKIKEDDSVEVTQKDTIMQRSSYVDNIHILVKGIYKDIDLTDATVLMRYVLPVSGDVREIYLTKTDSNYKDCGYVEYKIQAAPKFTAEAGDIRVAFTFIKLDTDENGEPIAYVRKTQSGVITITPISQWLDFTPSEYLSETDQRLLVMEAQLRAMDMLAQEGVKKIPTDISIVDDKTTRISLMNENGTIGEGIQINSLSDSIGDFIAGADDDGVKDGVTHLDRLTDVAVVDLSKL